MTIEVLNESGHDLDVKRLAQLSRFVMDRLRVHPLAELCIKAVDEDTMAGLNEKWMEGDGPTDVLAFPMDELRPGLVNEEPEEGILGDLVLCPSVAVEQARTSVGPSFSIHFSLSSAIVAASTALMQSSANGCTRISSITKRLSPASCLTSRSRPDSLRISMLNCALRAGSPAAARRGRRSRRTPRRSCRPACAGRRRGR